MNQVILIGNLTKDPEYRDSGVCRFSIAVNDRRKNPQTGEWEDSSSFIPIVVFGKTAQNCSKFLQKGSKVAVNGKIQTGSYEKDSRKVYTTDIIANNVEFLNKVEKEENSEGFSQITTDDVPW